MGPSLPLPIENAAFRSAVALLDAGDVEGLRRHLCEEPGLVFERVSFPEPHYFRSPALLEFVAENPVRRGVLPANIVAAAKVILDAGAKDDLSALNSALGLVASGRVARECNAQIPLIDLLADYGGDPNSAMPAALAHGEFEAADALLRRGARMSLAAAAATGQVELVRELVLQASGDDRHRAFALAAQFGHSEVVRLLLAAGEDPNRFNPAGFHAHSTPLHQAALSGHIEVVRLLIQHGARLDLRDTLWLAIPAEWARYKGRTEIEELLASGGSNERASTSPGTP